MARKDIGRGGGLHTIGLLLRLFWWREGQGTSPRALRTIWLVVWPVWAHLRARTSLRCSSRRTARRLRIVAADPAAVRASAFPGVLLCLSPVYPAPLRPVSACKVRAFGDSHHISVPRSHLPVNAATTTEWCRWRCFWCWECSRTGRCYCFLLGLLLNPGILICILESRISLASPAAYVERAPNHSSGRRQNHSQNALERFAGHCLHTVLPGPSPGAARLICGRFLHDSTRRRSYSRKHRGVHRSVGSAEGPTGVR